MADDIVDIAFTNVQLSDPVTGNIATITGTIAVDYTTNTVTGPLTATVTHLGVPINTYDFSANYLFIPTLAPTYFAGNTVGLNSVLFSYIGQAPSNLLTISASLGGEAFANVLFNTVTSTVVCFAAGTLIRTPRGDIPVETLQVGERVVTNSGESRAIKWIGNREIDCRRHPNPPQVLPVRIAAGAFGLNRPSQDLYLSPEHSVCVDVCGEVLIPVGNLVNGATVAPVDADKVSYWHVELDSHDILIANNLPAESYLEMANRAFFAEAGATLGDPAGRDRTYADFCRPVATDGPIVEFVRERLELQAQALGWTASRDADLHLLVDGCVRRPLAEGGTAAFVFDPSASDVRLKSNTVAPAFARGDPRPLGVALRSLVFAGSGGQARAVPIDDDRLGGGGHALESNDGASWRWTDGELILDRDFWDGLAGPVALILTYENSATRRWIAPAVVEFAESRRYAVA
jgi:hypothetical protein